MSFDVVSIPPFDRQLKRLAKKYPSIKHDLAVLGVSLSKGLIHGKPLGKNCFKIRMAITSKVKGKKAGARVISHFYFKENTIFLLSIYDKSEIENLTDKELTDLLRFIW